MDGFYASPIVSVICACHELCRTDRLWASGAHGDQLAASATRSRSVHLNRTTGMLLRTVDIGLEGVLPLAIRDLLDPLPGHLVGGVVDQNIELAQFRDRPLDQRPAVPLL
jgi:hypothetical protein